jgi:hypothetical protein
VFHPTSCEQRGKIARGNDPRSFVTVEIEQPVLVARHQIIGLARFGQGQQEVVGGIARAFNAR